jgi:hypothetical protein
MSQYPGGQPPQDPYYGQPADPYAPPPSAQQQPSDPYFGQGSADPYAPGAQQDQAYGQQGAYYDQQQQQPQQQQQQSWYAQQQAAWYAQQQAQAESRRGRGGSGAAIFGLLLVAVGVWILFGDEIDLDFSQLWPIAVVVLGILMVIGAFVPRRS